MSTYQTFSIVTLLLISSLLNSTTVADNQINTNDVMVFNDNNLVSNHIKQHAQINLVPLESAPTEAEPDPGTPTPTPIPIQRGSTNLPIVFGALAIVIVIILAWFFIGFLPNKYKD